MVILHIQGKMLMHQNRTNGLWQNYAKNLHIKVLVHPRIVLKQNFKRSTKTFQIWQSSSQIADAEARKANLPVPCSPCALFTLPGFHSESLDLADPSGLLRVFLAIVLKIKLSRSYRAPPRVLWYCLGLLRSPKSRFIL